MIRSYFAGKLLQTQRSLLCKYISSDLSKATIEKLESEQISEGTFLICSLECLYELRQNMVYIFLVVDDELLLKEEELERKRNKSRLNNHHRNILHENVSMQEAISWHQGTLKYLRRLYGRYGAASGVDPALCWPVKVIV